MTAPTTTSLADFLLACLADDEVAAIEAGGQPWRVDGRSVLAGTSPADVVVHDEAGSPNDGEAAHIARHDPTRVLANVAALRAVIDLGPTECSGYADQYEFNSHHYPDPAWSHCDGCASAESVDAVWAAALRALAQPYRGAEGWREAWVL